MPFFIDDSTSRFVCDPNETVEDGCMVLARLNKNFIARVVMGKREITLLPLDNPANVLRLKKGEVKLQRLTMRVEML